MASIEASWSHKSLVHEVIRTVMSRDMAFSDLVKATMANGESLRTRLMYDVICMMYGIEYEQ